jgi:hypothetical protein
VHAVLAAQQGQLGRHLALSHLFLKAEDMRAMELVSSRQSSHL